MPQVVEALLSEHVADANSRCRGCGMPGTGSAYLAWPCPLWTVADAARVLRDPGDQREKHASAVGAALRSFSH